MTTVNDAIQQQFGSAAEAYRQSAVHAQGADLTRMVALVQSHGARTVLDVGCGAGHVSVNVAPVVQHVTAYDLTEAMLTQVSLLAQERGLANVSTQAGNAEHMPFTDASFDIAMTRYSAHHWQNPALGVREMARVVKPGGWVIVSDIIALENYVQDTFLQTIETLRDASHVRDFRLSEWQAFYAAAGLTMHTDMEWALVLDFAAWVQRINTPPANVALLRQLLDDASAEVRSLFAITETSFSIPGALMIAQKQ